MPISHRHKCIFVHIPKTGGVSIEKHFKIKRLTRNLYRHSMYVKFQYYGIWYPLHHLPADIIKKIHPDTFKKYYKFSFVRNPYNRILSLYLYTHKKKWESMQNSGVEINDTVLAGISEKFEKWFDKFIQSNDYRKLTQTKFLFENKKLIVDEVFKFEDMEAELKKLKQKFKLEFDPHEIHNSSTTMFDRKKLLTPQIKEKIYNFYKEDFDNFGYEK